MNAPANAGAQIDQLLALNRCAEARDLARRALAQDPDSSDYLPRLAKAEMLLGNLDIALMICERAIAVAPDSDYEHALRATILYRFKRPKEAIEAANQALGLSPLSQGAWRALVFANVQLKRFDEACDAANELVALLPEDAFAFEIRGLARTLAADDVAAEPDLREAIRIDPMSFTAMRILGELLARTGRRAEAARFLHSAAAGDIGNEGTRAAFRRAVGEVDEGSLAFIGIACAGSVAAFLTGIWRGRLANVIVPLLVVALVVHVFQFVRRRSLQLSSASAKLIERIDEVEALEAHRELKGTVGTLVILLTGALLWMSWALWSQGASSMPPLFWAAYGFSAFILVVAVVTLARRGSFWN